MTEPAQTLQGTSFDREQVVKIISSVLSKVEGAEGEQNQSIFDEVKALETIINEARRELGAARPGQISDKHIPDATDELDAVVEATAEASNTIMDACDIIQEKAGGAGEAGDAITTEVMKIYEACSFQDITGQRITKVVKTLKEIEEKVQALVKVLNERIPVDDAAEEDDGTVDLLAGPQLPSKAVTQDDIDALLAEFD